MRRENKFVDGDRWAICDICADKVRRSQLRKDGKRKLLVCEACRDEVNPREYLRPPRRPTVQGDSRPASYYGTTVVCPLGAIPDEAVPSCACPDIIA